MHVKTIEVIPPNSGWPDQVDIDVTFEVGETDIIARVDVFKQQRPNVSGDIKPEKTFEAAFGYIYEHIIKFPYNVGKKERQAS